MPNYTLIVGDPSNTDLPEEFDVKHVLVGDIARIGVEVHSLIGIPQEEYFSVTIDKVLPNETFIGTCQNNLLHDATHGIYRGTQVEFEGRHILGI